jgi:hypothetical protein
MEETFLLHHTPPFWRCDSWTRLPSMMKPSNPWSESCKLNADTTLSPRLKQCLKTWPNHLRWWTILKTGRETLVTLWKVSKWALRYLPADIGHSKKLKSVISQPNWRMFKTHSTNSTRISSKTDKLTTCTAMGRSWFNLLTWRRGICLTCRRTSVPFAVCLTLQKSLLMDKFRVNLGLVT